MKEIKISTNSKNYSVLVGKDILKKSNFKEFSNREILLVIDSNIKDSVKQQVRTNIQPISSKFSEILIEANEENKSTSTLSLMHDILIENGYSRDCVLFALGGGITCDMTGFAAATYQRGVDFVLMPSTLLAQVDASVGGKTAINHPKGKNMIGAFHQPTKVLSDTQLLTSLDQSHLREGMAEIIKHSLIKDEGFFNWLEENIEDLLAGEDTKLLDAIAKSIEIKAEVVAKDETEQGVRKWLNLGHTFGHAIEVYGKFQEFTHGEAVALGIIMAANLSRSVLHLDEKESERIKSLISSILTDSLLQNKFEASALLKLMSADKKKKGDKLNFVLLDAIGSTNIVSDIKESDILQSIKLI